MLMNLKDLKGRKWAPSIQADIVRALAAGGFGKQFCGTAGAKILMWCSVRMSGDVSTVSPSLTTTDRGGIQRFTHGQGVFRQCVQRLFPMVGKHTRKERGGHSATELRQHHRHESGSTLELAAGILSMETNPRDYEEEAFARRMKKKEEDRTQTWHLDKTSINPFIYNSYAAEDDLRALAKIMEFGGAVSIFLLVVHVYVYCYPEYHRVELESCGDGTMDSGEFQ